MCDRGKLKGTVQEKQVKPKTTTDNGLKAKTRYRSNFQVMIVYHKPRTTMSFESRQQSSEEMWTVLPSKYCIVFLLDISIPRLYWASCHRWTPCPPTWTSAGNFSPCSVLCFEQEGHWNTEAAEQNKENCHQLQSKMMELKCAWRTKDSLQRGLNHIEDCHNSDPSSLQVGKHERTGRGKLGSSDWSF